MHVLIISVQGRRAWRNGQKRQYRVARQERQGALPRRLQPSEVRRNATNRCDTIQILVRGFDSNPQSIRVTFLFTGIIQHLGRVSSVESKAFGASLAIEALGWNHRAAPGESIAVNGCCLTVAGPAPDGVLHFDVIRQTLDVTALGLLRPGSKVNLEHAITPQTLLGGHIVQGHIDGRGMVASVDRSASEHRVRIQVERDELMDTIVDKGSIAVQGVSLTVSAVGTNWLEVALIPTTIRLTNLGELESGDLVNLETDYLAKIVANLLRRDRK